MAFECFTNPESISVLCSAIVIVLSAVAAFIKKAMTGSKNPLKNISKEDIDTLIKTVQEQNDKVKTVISNKKVIEAAETKPDTD